MPLRRGDQIDTQAFGADVGALVTIGARGNRLEDVWADGPVTYLGLGVPGFPNLFTVNGPGSPSVLANMATHSEQQVDWCLALIATCRRDGIDAAEPRKDAAEKWTDHLGEVAAGTLFVRAASWYMGANIEGKPRVFMPYAGGLDVYRQECDRIAAQGYPGFTHTS